MMQERICPLLLISKGKESKKTAFCLKEECSWWFFRSQTVTETEKTGKCSLVQIAEALR
jgi:hypothetical protein